jgi:hypothetical protein
MHTCVPVSSPAAYEAEGAKGDTTAKLGMLCSTMLMSRACGTGAKAELYMSAEQARLSSGAGGSFLVDPWVGTVSALSLSLCVSVRTARRISWGGGYRVIEAGSQCRCPSRRMVRDGEDDTSHYPLSLFRSPFLCLCVSARVRDCTYVCPYAPLAPATAMFGTLRPFLPLLNSRA